MTVDAHDALDCPASVKGLLAGTRVGRTMELTQAAHTRMQAAADVLRRTLDGGADVYGVTRGFGPLAEYPGAPSGQVQGRGLIAHLAAGQGRPLRPEVSRLMVWLRLHTMQLGYSGVDPDTWQHLTEAWNRGFTPVVPSEGSVSASGDLVPLAHAALALAGEGRCWLPRSGDTTGWDEMPAREALHRIGSAPIRWDARDALAFVNGTSAALAQTCHNHAAVQELARALALLTGRTSALLGSNPEHFATELAEAHGHPGHVTATSWLRQPSPPAPKARRPFQEPYSIRCVPQIIGAVVDTCQQLESLLVHDARGCSDNPVIVGSAVYHGGNFHALPVGLVSEMHALCAHQLAYTAERQLAVLIDPNRNGGRNPMLTPSPGYSSGLAGVQIVTSSLVARIRQLALPASLTSLPTNLGNQDQVPMALNSAIAVDEIIDRSWIVLGSLLLTINQLAFLDEVPTASDDFWAETSRQFHPVEDDRPLAVDIRRAAQFVHAEAKRLLDGQQPSPNDDRKRSV